MNSIEKKEQLKQEWQQKGQDFPAELEEDFSKKFDSNVITPGTEFMHRMSKAVQVLYRDLLTSIITPHYSITLLKE